MEVLVLPRGTLSGGSSAYLKPRLLTWAYNHLRVAPASCHCRGLEDWVRIADFPDQKVWSSFRLYLYP
jgi:hypothetical protein